MTNEELKEKIKKVLDEAIRWRPYYAISRGIVYESDLDNIANALIAAGLTFDGEYKKLYEEEKAISQSLRGTSWQFKGWYEEQKRRAEVAEKAARDLIAYYCNYTMQSDIDSSLSVALQQAEKELAEERKEC